MSFGIYLDTLPADRIDIYGFATEEPNRWDFLTMYSLGDIKCFGTYLGPSYAEAISEAGRLEALLGLPVYDLAGLSGDDFENMVHERA